MGGRVDRITGVELKLLLMQQPAAVDLEDCTWQNQEGAACEVRTL